MIPKIQKRFDRLETGRLAFLNEMDALNERQLLFRPFQEHWNLTEIVQHLMLVEQSFLSQITEREQRIRKARFHLVIGSMFVWLYFKLNFKVRVPVKGIIPREKLSLEQASSLWEEKRKMLKNYITALDQNGASQKRFFHPIMGPLNTVRLMGFLVLHFDHHMKQVERIKRAPQFPK